jgi:predicted AAA+ superfamily ATPase
MIGRNLETAILDPLSPILCVYLTGARQVGNSTLAQSLIQRGREMVAISSRLGHLITNDDLSYFL